jgi:hypothetical protein
MKHLKMILVTLAIPYLIICYVVWHLWWSMKYNQLPNEKDEHYFLTEDVMVLIAFYYAFITSYLCIVYL